MQEDRHRRSKTTKVVLGRFYNSLDGLLTIALGSWDGDTIDACMDNEYL